MMGSDGTTQAKILIADDERSITDGLSAILADEGYEVEVALDGQRALERLMAESYGVILADLKMPKLDGIALLKELQQRDIPTECIIITGQATVDSAVQSMRQGAYDYIEKPLNAEKLNRVKALIPKALERFALHQKNRELASKLEGLTHYGELTGHSESMRNVYQMIEAVAPSTASVLILGESGTGKELVARAMHSKSERVKGPFLALNCAALPKDILENELFGHEKGAFTGSTNEKAGAFEMAHGGTLFLDEVAEMPPDIQVKLLRAIETRTIRRLGGKKEITVDIRIVAATNRDLQQAIADGDLREDLYYRLAVVEVFLPPLRERVGDIKLLATEFLSRYALENNKKVMGFEDSSWDWILAYHWPGNVRELKNAVERAVIMTRGSTIGPQDITPRHIRRNGENAGSLTIQVGSSMADARRKVLLGTFAATDGDPVRTAKLLGVTPAMVQAEMIGIVTGGREEPQRAASGSEKPRRGREDEGRRGAPPASPPRSAARPAPAKVAPKVAPKGKAKAKSGRSR